MSQEAELPSLFLFDDEPVRSHHEDALQLQGFSRTIAAAAVGSPGPFTIGIFAGWGQGKTSILRQARSLIDRAPNQQHAVTAWINAWRFEQEEHPIVPIILSILDGIYQKLKKGTNPADPKERFLSKAHRALSAIAYGFGFKGKIKVPLLAEVEVETSVKDMLERYEKLAPQPDPLVEKSLYYHAYEILDGVLDDEAFENPPFPKIVVFIDDLDRCLPDKALKVFESIKLVLAQRGFVFVLAVDRDVIDAFLTKRYRHEFGLSEEHHHGEQYMDKIIQLALHIPHHEGRFEDYIKNLIAADGASAPSIQGKLLKREEREVFAALAKPLAAGTDRNPRSLIRILNRLLTDKFLWDQLPLELKAGKPIQDADELLRFAAISRIIENSLGIARYRELVRSDAICQELTELLEKYGVDRGFGLTGAAEADPFAKRVLTPRGRETIAQIEKASPLRELLHGAHGRAWLADRDKRQAVESFLDSTRAEDSAGSGLTPGQIIAHAIRESLGLAKDMAVTPEHRARVTSLNLSETEITNILALSPLRALEELNLWSAPISDLSPLPPLKSLKRLFLGFTNVLDISPLRELVELEHLDLSGTKITDISPLAELHKLQQLELDQSSISDLSPLAGLERLKTLNLVHTNVSNLEPLAALESLEILNLHGSPVSSVAAVAGLSRLKALDLAAAKVSNISALSRLRNLEVLDLSGTAVRDLAPLSSLHNLRFLYLGSLAVEDLSPLVSVRNLEHLYLEETPASTDDAQLSVIRRALPNCELHLFEGTPGT